MKKAKFNVVTDGQWGSCGKGMVTTALAFKHRPDILSTTNMSNAGHTAVSQRGDKFVAKALPSAAILNRWQDDYFPSVVVGPSAAFDLSQMLKEIQECGVENSTYIHPRAGVILDEHKQRENDNQTGTKHVASTMQGCGAFLADKVMRVKGLKLANDYGELKKYCEPCLRGCLPGQPPLSIALNDSIELGRTILHEGSQGFSLDINHGSHYPECTSRGTTATQNIADMGINLKNVGDIYLVIRPYPIRVGNVVEEGATVGYSGGCYTDHQETDWNTVANNAGAPPEVMQGELTTVTKRLRRVFTFSPTQVHEAAVINSATKIALNFANYIDWSCYGKSDPDCLSTKITDFIKRVEDITGVKVGLVGTGPQLDHVCYL